MLTSQCVKLNSSFMDEIIDIDTKPLYKEAKEQNIPYHLVFMHFYFIRFFTLD